MLFGELFSVFHADQRRVQIARLGQTQGVLQRDLARGVVGQVFAAHHIGDALLAIVDDHGQLVGPEPVRSAQHKVAHAGKQVLLLGAQTLVLPVQHGALAFQARVPDCYALRSCLRLLVGCFGLILL